MSTTNGYITEEQQVHNVVINYGRYRRMLSRRSLIELFILLKTNLLMLDEQRRSTHIDNLVEIFYKEREPQFRDRLQTTISYSISRMSEEYRMQHYDGINSDRLQASYSLREYERQYGSPEKVYADKSIREDKKTRILRAWADVEDKHDYSSRLLRELISNIESRDKTSILLSRYFAEEEIAKAPN